jgi:hypothetical protein
MEGWSEGKFLQAYYTFAKWVSTKNLRLSGHMAEENESYGMIGWEGRGFTAWVVLADDDFGSHILTCLRHGYDVHRVNYRLFDVAVEILRSPRRRRTSLPK